MGPFRVMIFSIFILILAAINGSSVESSKHFKVGDHIGWQQPSANNTAVYTLWATSKRFHVGDSLSFEYENDSVLVVEKWDFYHCNTNKPISSFNDGKTVIYLDRSGLFYFISRATDHCNKGQKLLVQVMSLHQGLLAPVPHPSSGLVVTVTLGSVFVALIVTGVILV